MSSHFQTQLRTRRVASFLFFALLMYIFLIFYIPRCIIHNIPYISYHASLPFLYCCQRTITQWYEFFLPFRSKEFFRLVYIYIYMKCRKLLYCMLYLCWIFLGLKKYSKTFAKNQISFFVWFFESNESFSQSCIPNPHCMCQHQMNWKATY